MRISDWSSDVCSSDLVLTSYTELVANPTAAADPEKRHAMDQIQTLLDGVMEARGNVLVKLNVAEPDLDAVIAILPSMKSPTVSRSEERRVGKGWGSTCRFGWAPYP